MKSILLFYHFLNAVLGDVWRMHQPALIQGKANQSFVQKISRRRLLSEYTKAGGDPGECADLEKCNCHCLCSTPKWDPTYKPGPMPCPTPLPGMPNPADAPPPPPPPAKPVICDAGFLKVPVKLTFECIRITFEVLEALKHNVIDHKHKLDEMVTKFNARNASVAEDLEELTGNDLPCVGMICNSPHGKGVFKAHEAFKKALDLYIAALQAYIPLKQLAPPPGPKTKCPPGKEFTKIVELPTKGNLHCEPWTVNKSRADLKYPTKEQCGVICRGMQNCMGFALHEHGPCVWWDNSETHSTAKLSDACAEGEVTQMYQKHCTSDCDKTIITTVNGGLQELQAIIGSLDLMWESAVSTADRALKQGEHKYGGYFWETDGWQENVNSSLQDQLNWAQTHAVNEYGGAIWNISQAFQQLKLAAVASWKNVNEEVDKCPVFPQPIEISQKKLEEQLDNEGKKIPKWSLFKNSKDNKWSAEHPQCPQGPPCNCDCGCRGKPFQNFIEPPPPPFPVPCPSGLFPGAPPPIIVPR